MPDSTTITTIQTTSFVPSEDPDPPTSKSAAHIILLSFGGAIIGILVLALVIEFCKRQWKHCGRGLVTGLENITVPGIDAPAAFAEENADASAVPNSPPPQYTWGMRITGWWRMKVEGLRMRMKEWQECRKKENDNVEMGEISRSRLEPLSM